MTPFGERNRGSGDLPDEITAGGRTRTVSQHTRKPHEQITAERIQYVLEHWVIRGTCTDSRGTQSLVHWSYVLGFNKMVRVVVSLDGNTIVTAYPDRTAGRHWDKGNFDYFTMRCEDIEVRDAGYI